MQPNTTTMKKRRFFTRRTGFIFCFLLPGVALFALFYAYPLVNIFITSFSKWDYQNFNAPKFLGFSHLFDNYIQIFTKDYYFWTALLNTLKWVALTLIVQVPLAVLVAVVLSKKPVGWALARNAFIIPNIISTAAIGLIFFNLYNPNYGAVTEIIRAVTPDAQINILANGKLAFWGVTFSFLLFAGSNTILVLAQIFAISPDLFEAARIDGANATQTFFRITLPMLRPMIGTIAILAANYSLLLYNEIALISGGGPDKATYSLGFFIFQKALGSTKLNFALANTAGVIQFILGIILVGMLTKLFRTNESDL